MNRAQALALPEEALMEIGQELGSFLAASCYGYTIGKDCVTFDMIEHGEKFCTDLAFVEFETFSEMFG